MADTCALVPPSATPAGAASRQPTPSTSAICPYLLASGGAWRASTPSRDHRCTAVTPAALLTADKQRRLCLIADHQACATFQAATGISDLEPARLGGGHRIGRATRATVRTTPVVLDHGRISVAMPVLRRERGGLGQGLVIGLMAVAFAAIIVARVSTGGAGGEPSPRAVAGAAAGATATPRPTAVGADVTSEPESPDRTLVPTEAEPTAEATAKPDPTAEPTQKPARSTYKVKRGDTLSGIAATYGTTVRKLMRLNNIEDASRLRVGQVLKLR